ncbi:hypothetical protein Patl1_32098 [Pistacia atlantica]|uniref:Uncharacterized protein n=1 Tax=Pistacia atlantica TaxID=434234 RepID=A0ACC1AQ40_9ROSI|nr:hypothetical protein Patl1_32098 [Pistacia atlantica]
MDVMASMEARVMHNEESFAKMLPRSTKLLRSSNRWCWTPLGHYKLKWKSSDQVWRKARAIGHFARRRRQMGSSSMSYLLQGSKFQDHESMGETKMPKTGELSMVHVECEIKKQFYPGNVAYETRKKMRELKDTGPISRKLQRHQVVNIFTAFTEANTLVEFRKGESSKLKKDGKPDYRKGGRREGRQTISPPRKWRQAAS